MGVAGMFESYTAKQKEKSLAEKIDRIENKLNELLKLIKENKNSAKTSQNSSK